MSKNFQGTIDYWGDHARWRNQVVDTIRNTFESFGFEPLETPLVELRSTLSGKEGTQKFFPLGSFRSVTENSKGGVRFDHTVPLARFMAQNWEQFPLPFRRYAIGPVMRDETTQAGRTRQFWQCDFDTVGSTNPIIDAEIVAINYEILSSLGFGDKFTIRINDRRVLDSLGMLMEPKDDRQLLDIARAWDKLEKATHDEIEIELQQKGFSKEQISNFFNITEDLLVATEDKTVLKRLESLVNDDASREALNNLVSMLDMISAMSVPDSSWQLFPLMARGLDYYTGPIFETVVYAKDGVSTITGGGRFDNLINALGGPDMPASGSSFGLERVMNVMENIGLKPNNLQSTDVFVTVFDQNNQELVKKTFEIATRLRLTGYRTEVYTGQADKLGKQLDIARRKQIPFAIILGPEELQNDKVTLKDMNAPKGSQTQFTIPIDRLDDTIWWRLNA